MQPRLQALGTTTCFRSSGSGGTRWLADSSGLVVSSSSGYHILGLDGQLREPPAFAGRTWSGEPQPAPDNADRFAIGRTTVTNGAGTRTLGVTLKDWVTPASLSPWGDSSSELRLALPPPGKGGACSERPPMPATVLTAAQSLPEFPLTTNSPGTCRELRAGPHSNFLVVTCLPHGTRLAPVPQRTSESGIEWLDQSWWLSVKTEKGETGWISLAGNPIAWAEP